MTIVEAFTPEPIRITENTVQKVRSLLQEEDNFDLKLRVFVTGGGCSGFQYGFSFEELVSEDDFVISKDDISVVIDSISYPYLVGAEIDYHEDLQGSRFLVNNPNASSTCGCGVSFSV